LQGGDVKVLAFPAAVLLLLDEVPLVPFVELLPFAASALE